MDSDIELAFRMVDSADAETMRRWSPGGTPSRTKEDGTPVTEADVAAENAMLTLLRDVCPNDGFLGEEVGEHVGTSGRRWIADGIDGTYFFAAGDKTWGTLLALEISGEIAQASVPVPPSGGGGGPSAVPELSPVQPTVKRHSHQRLQATGAESGTNRLSSDSPRPRCQ